MPDLGILITYNPSNWLLEERRWEGSRIGEGGIEGRGESRGREMERNMVRASKY